MPQNVLLVDDEPAVLDSLRRSLRRESFVVHIAKDAEDFDTAVILAEEMHLQIAEGNQALEPKIGGSASP